MIVNIPQGYALVPLDPPGDRAIVVSGTRTVNGKATTVWLGYTSEAGGWHQWEISAIHAHRFQSEAKARSAAKSCPGPAYNMPDPDSITIGHQPTEGQMRYRAAIMKGMAATAAAGIVTNEESTND